MPFDARFQWLTSIKSENDYIASGDKAACQTGTKAPVIGREGVPWIAWMCACAGLSTLPFQQWPWVVLHKLRLV